LESPLLVEKFVAKPPAAISKNRDHETGPDMPVYHGGMRCLTFKGNPIAYMVGSLFRHSARLPTVPSFPAFISIERVDGSVFPANDIPAVAGRQKRIGSI